MKIRELDSKESAPVLKAYIGLEGFAAPYFDVKSDSPVGAFEDEASKHPVFFLEEL